MLATAAVGLVGQIVGLFGARGKATQESLKARQENMARTWTDEFLVLYWFSPTIVAWFDPIKSEAMQKAMFATDELTAIQAALTAAVFGLGKMNSKK